MPENRLKAKGGIGAALIFTFGIFALGAVAARAVEPLVRLLPTSPLRNMGGLEVFEGRYITRQAWSVDGSDWTVTNTESWDDAADLYRAGEVLVYQEAFSAPQWSGDGAQWTAIGDGLPAPLRYPTQRALVWWQDRYLLFASQENPGDGSLTGKVFESTDLLTFTERGDCPLFNTILSNGEILIGSDTYWTTPPSRSTDGGMTWEPVTPPVADRSFEPCGEANGVFYFYSGQASVPDYLYASTNGIDWISAEIDSSEIQKAFFLLDGRPALLLSSSGGDFIRVYEPGTLQPLERITLPLGEEWDLIAQNGDDLLAISIWGTIARWRASTWEILHFGDVRGSGGAVGNGLIVYSGVRANYLSADGSAWSATPHGVMNLEVKAFREGTFLARDGNKVRRSQDGQTWDLVTAAAVPTSSPVAITQFAGKVLLRGWYSLWKIGTDGYSWTQVAFPDSYVPDGIIGWGQDDRGMLVGTQSSSTPVFWWSEDGGSWTRVDPPFAVVASQFQEFVAANGAFHFLFRGYDGAYRIARFHPDSGWDLLEGTLPQWITGFAGAAGQLFLQTDKFENRQLYSVNAETGAAELLYEVPGMQPLMQASAFRGGIVLLTDEEVWGIGIESGESPPTAKLVSSQSEQTLLPGSRLGGEIVYDREVTGAVVEYFDNGRLAFTSEADFPLFAFVPRGSGLHRIEARVRLPDGAFVSTAALEVEVAAPVLTPYEIPFPYYSAEDANSHALILSTDGGWRFSTDLRQWGSLDSPSGYSATSIFESRGMFFIDSPVEDPAFTLDQRTWMPTPQAMTELQSVFHASSLGTWAPTRFYGLRVGDFTWLTSSDMVHWQEVDFGGVNAETSSLLTAANRDRVVACYGGKIWWSADGVDFQPAAVLLSGLAQRLLYDGHEFVALDDQRAHFSRDGANWTTLIMASGTTDLKFSKGTFYRENGAGMYRKFEYACDGLNWRTLATPELPSYAELVQIGSRVGILAGSQLYLIGNPIPERPGITIVAPEARSLEPEWGSVIDFEFQVTGVTGVPQIDLYRGTDRIATVSGKLAKFSLPVNWSGDALIWAQAISDAGLVANSEPVTVRIQYPHALELVEAFSPSVQIQDLLASNGRLVAVGTEGFIAYKDANASWKSVLVRVKTTEGIEVPLDLFQIIPTADGGYMIRAEQGIVVTSRNLQDDFEFLAPASGASLQAIEGDLRGYFVSLSDDTIVAEYADGSTAVWPQPVGPTSPIMGLTRQRVWMGDPGTSNLWWRWRDGSNEWQALTVPQISDFAISDSGGGFLLYRSETGILAINDESLAITPSGVVVDFLDSVEVVPGFAFMGTRDTMGQFELRFSTNFESWSALPYPGTTPSGKGSLAQLDGFLWLAVENNLYRLKQLSMDGLADPTPVLRPFADRHVISWQTLLGHDYALDRATNLPDWETRVECQGTGQTVEVTMPPESNPEVNGSFYRIRQTIPAGSR